MDDKYTMNNLEMGQSADIEEIYFHGAFRRRFFDIGFLPGNVVECVGISPLGDPKAYRVNDTVVAVRNDDARLVKVGNIISH